MLSRLRSLISLCLLALAATHGLFAQAAPVPVPDAREWQRLTPDQRLQRQAEIRERLKRATPEEKQLFRERLRELLVSLPPQERRGVMPTYMA